jgi:hypothetical protein
MRSKYWTAEEDAFLLAHPDKKDAAMVAKHLGRSVISINARRTRKGLAVSLAGASYRPIEYPGPDGWNLSQGAPCAVCRKIASKFDDETKHIYSRECRCCSARIRWADYTASAVPMTGYVQNVDKGYSLDVLQEII